MGIRHNIPAGLPAGTVAGKVAGDNWRDDHLHVPFEVALLIAQGNTVHTPGASLTVNTELFATGKPTRNIIDLSQARQVRLTGVVTALGNAPTAAVKLQYHTLATEAATWAGTDCGVSLVVGTGTAGTIRDSGWQPLAAGAQVDNLVIAAVIGVAFGTTSPALGNLTVFFK